MKKQHLIIMLSTDKAENCLYKNNTSQKLYSNNEVIISLIENKTYTKEEVKQLIKDFAKFAQKFAQKSDDNPYEENK